MTPTLATPSFLASFAAAITLLAGAADAQTSNYRAIDATAGRVTRLAVVTALKTDCSAGTIGGVKVVTPPRNGDLQLKRGKLTTPASFRCPNKETQAEAVFYRPKSGYSGDDQIVYETKSADGTIERFTVRVTVKPGAAMTPAKPGDGKPGDGKTGDGKPGDKKDDTLEL